MTFKKFLYSAATMISFAALPGACLVLGSAPAHAQQAAVAIDDDDIGGVVRGPAGPEAGVWVIAETTELPTKFAKMVVTDDQGRYVIPDLPLRAPRTSLTPGIESPRLDGVMLHLDERPCVAKGHCSQGGSI